MSSLTTPGRFSTWAEGDSALGSTLGNLASTLALISARLYFFAATVSRLMGVPNLLLVVPKAVSAVTSGDVPVAKMAASWKKKPSHWAKVRFSCLYVSTSPPNASTGRHKFADVTVGLILTKIYVLLGDKWLGVIFVFSVTCDFGPPACRY